MPTRRTLTRRLTQALLYGLLAVWVAAIKIKRWLAPRGFRLVMVRRRCDRCGRRLRPGLVKRQATAPLCKKCLRHLYKSS